MPFFLYTPLTFPYGCAMIRVTTEMLYAHFGDFMGVFYETQKICYCYSFTYVFVLVDDVLWLRRAENEGNREW